MSKIEALIENIKGNPRKCRYEEYVRVIKRYEGKIMSSGGSHRAAKFLDGPRITFVEPHGGFQYMHPGDVKKLLIALNEMGEIEL